MPNLDPQSPGGDQNSREVITKATIRAAAHLDLPNVVLARVLGLSESQVSRITRGMAGLEGKPLEIGLLLVRVIRGLAGIIGHDDEAARSWLRTPNTALRGTPLQLIQTITGLVNVVDYLDSRRARH